jgi:hypothetical protein
MSLDSSCRTTQRTLKAHTYENLTGPSSSQTHDNLLCLIPWRHQTCNIREVTSVTSRRVTAMAVSVFCHPAALCKNTVQLAAVKVAQLHGLSIPR